MEPWRKGFWKRKMASAEREPIIRAKRENFFELGIDTTSDDR